MPLPLKYLNVVLPPPLRGRVAYTVRLLARFRIRERSFKVLPYLALTFFAPDVPVFVVGRAGLSLLTGPVVLLTYLHQRGVQHWPSELQVLPALEGRAHDQTVDPFLWH